MRDLLAVDHLMWGSDFPHSVSSYPESRRWLDVIFDGVPAEVRRQVLVDNPVTFFGLRRRPGTDADPLTRPPHPTPDRPPDPSP